MPTKINKAGNSPSETRLVQINLKKKISASENLLIFMNENNLDISLIQEPWVNGRRIQGLNSKEFNLFYKVPEGDSNPRSCILVRKGLIAFLLTDYCDEDTTAVILESGNETIILVSAYLSHDKDIPQSTLRRLAERKGNLILGCDANARHVAWGNTATNERGECLTDFISNYNLTLQNKGDTPTFIFPSTDEWEEWEAVLDVTLTRSTGIEMVKNWRVSLENSFSDHRFILFNIDFKKTEIQSFRNPRKTDWKKFKKYTYSKLKSSSKENLTISEIEGEINCLNRTLKHAFEVSTNISKPKLRKFPPYFDKNIIDLRRKMRTQFNSSYKSGDWWEYRILRDLYKKERRKTQSKGWKDFCEAIESTKDTARLRKILSKTTPSPAFIKNAGGSWAESSRETNEILLTTHFPGCKDFLSTEEDLCATKTNDMGPSLITCEKVKWAIGTFEPFKSPGPDGIIPKMLQTTVEKVTPLLVKIYRNCINLEYIPKAWRDVRVVFIPKAGKVNHCTAKDYRPISLSSFVLKIMERILDLHIRRFLNSETISSTQHAYVKGKSVDTALHETARTIESSLQYGQYTLAAFLDIEGAFNNVKLSAIVNSLSTLGVEKPIRLWISKMLCSRVITSTIGDNSLQKLVDRGTPQGGVLSPLLWLIVVNEILKRLKLEGISVVAYADDIVILVSGLFLNTLSERVETALNMMVNWADMSGLGINPAKTELVLFRKGYKTPNFYLPKLKVKFYQALMLSNQAKFLGVILDSRMTWKNNIEERSKKAHIAYYVCRKAFGKTWGLSPKLVYWIFTAVVRPILSYGASVWWNALLTANNCKKLEHIPRCVCIGITGALRSTSTESLLNILSIQPMRLYTQLIAARTAIRLSSLSLWKTKPYGHSNILNQLNIKIPKQLDTCITEIDFSNNYEVIITKRREWKTADPTTNFETVIFTDGSKSSVGCGAGFIVSKTAAQNCLHRQSYRLPNDCSIFQCEIFAITSACKFAEQQTKICENICICIDSQAALKALASFRATSKVVKGCKEALNRLGSQSQLTLIWVPRHCNIEGNEKADQLAKIGAEKHISWSEGIPSTPAAVQLLVKNRLEKDFQEIWRKSKGIYKYIWGPPNQRSTEYLLRFDRNTIRKITFIVTGHWPIGRHARRMGITEGTACPGCGLTPMDTDCIHFWCLCPALSRLRISLLGGYWINNIEELLSIQLEKRIEFITLSNWF